MCKVSLYFSTRARSSSFSSFQRIRIFSLQRAKTGLNETIQAGPEGTRSMGEGTMCSTPGRYGSKSCGGADVGH